MDVDEIRGVALATESLGPGEAQFLSFLDGISTDIVEAVVRRSGYQPAARRLLCGESDSADGWTDGSTYIYIHRRFLQQSINVDSVTAALMLLIHEYLHDSSDQVGHSPASMHDLEFYRAFHDIVSYGWFGYQSITAWVSSKLESSGA